ncbi:SCO family protein [Laceyella putida]|uniref:SCO family protein n=1 Tax=Laceyella putida TaxID=110101 RepID=A0ABW2RIJ5_9BACL
MNLFTYKWLPLCICLFLLVTACAPADPAPTDSEQQNTADNNDVSDLNWRVPDFEFTDQAGKTFGLKDLKGKVWLADFIFTRCPNVCPPMTANMAKVQDELKKAEVQVELVSFSVDPDYDKPDVLKAYAEKHQADFSNWHLLTGYSLDEITKMTKDTFKAQIAHQKGTSPDVPLLVTHPTQFYLIDGTGKVVRFYNGLQPDATQIAKDIKAMGK